MRDQIECHFKTRKQTEVIVYRPSFLNKDMHSKVFSAYATHVVFVHLLFGVNEHVVSTVCVFWNTGSVNLFERYFRDSFCISILLRKQIVLFSVNIQGIILVFV